MNTWWIISLFCLGPIVCAAQDEKEALLSIPATGSSPEAFFPKGYDSTYIARGDMDKDGLEDRAIVLMKADEGAEEEKAGEEAEEGPDPGNRLLIVVLRTADGWKLGGKSARAVYCRTCGGVFGDPFESITIQKGVLVVEHYGGSHTRWASTTKFQYRGDACYLIGRTTVNMPATWDCEEQPIELVDIDLLTGGRYRRTITTDCKDLLDKKDRIAKKPLVRLEDVLE